MGPGGRATAKGTPVGRFIDHLQDEGGEDAVGLGANILHQQHAPSKSLWIWRLLLGPRPPVPGGPALPRAGPPLPQLAGRAERPGVDSWVSYCRNPDNDPDGPWCYVSGEASAPKKRPCEDLRCPETASQALPASTAETEEASEVPGEDEVFAPANALPAQSEAAAVQPVIGISQRVRVNSKEKKDLGTLGYVLGVAMMVIIIIIGAGIVLGYTYKRGKDLREQHEQKVCEREMQRITLPLSAFTNPTCEIVDEKTVVVHTNQTPVDLQEGSAPLMGQAGTPGA
uniref:Phosphoinositide-3-kinase interacting protein 1 n=1 Tax=Equus caballus TaxID=9796 RepID=F7DIF3_HORSE